jgi:hypothetical protein
MKINVEVDCTPEEARRMMGLPDLTPVHDKYIQMLTESMDGRPPTELLDTVFKSWGPMNEAGLSFWRRIFEAGSGSRSDG